MIKADGVDFWIEGEIKELVQEFGGICISFLHNGFEMEELLEIVMQSKDIYEKNGKDIQELED